MMRYTMMVGILGLFWIAVMVAIFVMLVSLAKQGDERRRMIVEKSSAAAFAVTVCYVVSRVAVEIYKAVSGAELVSAGMDPIVLLVVISIVYAAALLHYKRKYGD